MKLRKTAAFFDLDGVLINSEALIKAAFAHVFKTFNITDPRVLERGGLNGYALDEVYGLIAQGEELKSMKKTHADFQINNLHLVEAIEDVIIALLELKKMGIKVAIVTNRHGNAEHIIKHCGFRDLVDLIVSADTVKKTKPHPEGIQMALAYFDVKPEEAIMVGDSAVDIIAGREAGVTTVGVDTSVALEELKASKPDYMVSSLTDILPWFFKN